MKPVWLLDVDGVINAISKKGDPNVWPRDHWRWASIYALIGRKYEPKESNWFMPILWSTDVVDFINEMAEFVDIRWHTTWQEVAPANLAPALGILNFPVADERDLHIISHDKWWKITAVENALFDEGKPVIWTDDDIWIYKRGKSMQDILNADCLAIAPNQNIGLSKNNLKTIREFVDEHKETD